MPAHFIHFKDPFRPSLNREESPLIPGQRIIHVLEKKKLIVNGRRVTPYVVMINGEFILQKDWNRRIRSTDLLSVANLPRGGGGGSNPLQIVAMVAIIALSVYTGGVAGAAFGAGWGAAAAAAVQITGTMLLSMIFKTPTASSASVATDSTSPTYSLTATGNTARLLAAIPVLYGHMQIVPDFASQPYTEIQGNDQYLYQLFVISQGYVEIDSINLGGTDISSFPDVTYEVVQPNENVTLFPTNVVTSTSVSSQVLYGPDNSEFAVIGPFVATPPAVEANFIAVDISLPGGGYHIDDSGNKQPVTVTYIFDYQEIDDNGNPIGNFVQLVQNTLTLSSAQPIRITHKVAVPSGRYQVRGQRSTSDHSDDSTYASTLQWDNLRGYVPASTSFGNITMLAMIMKATNSLTSTSSRQVQVVATRKLNTWDPVNGWTTTPVATRNPAWAFADVLKNPTYGRNFPDSRFNLAEVYRLSGVWDSRGDTFNGVFDTTAQLWDSLTKVAQVGRAMPMYYAGVIDIIRNEPKTLPVAMFQPANMKSGSFNTTYQFADVDTPDYVTIQYTDPSTWQPNTVDCILPGGTSNTPSNITLFGCTDRDQAWREGITMAAINKYQRRIISFTTELEGLIPRYNDLCQISHDVPAWGYSGRVLAFDPNTKYVTLSEPLVFTPGESHVIAFRARNGSADGPYPIVASPRGIPTEGLVSISDADIATLYISDGIRSELTLYQFGPTEQAGILGCAMSATPDSSMNVALTFANYAPEIFLAETGGIIPDPTPPSTLPTNPGAPTVDSVSLQYTFTVGQQTLVASPSVGASYYEWQVSSNQGTTWIALGTTNDPQIDVALAPGQWYFRVRGVGLLPGAWTTNIAQVQATTLPLVAIGAFTATPALFGVDLAWTIAAGNAGIASTVQIWKAEDATLGDASMLYETGASGVGRYTDGNMGPGETHFYWIRVIDEAGREGPWFNNSVATVGQSSSDTTQILAQLGGSIGESQLSEELQTKIDSGGGSAVAIDQITNELAAMYAIKTQLTVDNVPYMAGIGVGVENDSGVITSQILLSAQRVAVIDETQSSTTGQYPFIISGGVVYMNSAFIQNASITNAKIAGVIQSNLVNAQGNPAWSFDKNGVLSIYGYGGSGSGRLIIQNNQILIYDENGTLRVQLGAL